MHSIGDSSSNKTETGHGVQASIVLLARHSLDGAGVGVLVAEGVRRVVGHVVRPLGVADQGRRQARASWAAEQGPPKLGAPESC
jgi:hypothetical protein